MKRSLVIGIAGVAVLIIAVLVLGNISRQPKENTAPSLLLDSPHSITLFKSPQCGCCAIYANYLKGKAKSEVIVKNVASTTSVHEQYKVPQAMWSCHTTIIDGYVVEGHIPVEAINKLLSEKPDIAGIAMPGMPSGSPGMPGAKSGPFVIYALNKDGTTSEYTRL